MVQTINYKGFPIEYKTRTGMASTKVNLTVSKIVIENGRPLAKGVSEETSLFGTLKSVKRWIDKALLDGRLSNI